MLEANGKPCCINLITDNDRKFLKNLERQAKKQKLKELEEAGEFINPDDENLTEEDKAKLAEQLAAKKELESEEEEDEVDALIKREEEEHNRALKEAEARKLAEEDAAVEKAAKDEKEAQKLEQIRQQERDLLDQRSQPIR